MMRVPFVIALALIAAAAAFPAGSLPDWSLLPFDPLPQLLSEVRVAAGWAWRGAACGARAS